MAKRSPPSEQDRQNIQRAYEEMSKKDRKRLDDKAREISSPPRRRPR